MPCPRWCACRTAPTAYPVIAPRFSTMRGSELGETGDGFVSLFAHRRAGCYHVNGDGGPELCLARELEHPMAGPPSGRVVREPGDHRGRRPQGRQADVVIRPELPAR